MNCPLISSNAQHSNAEASDEYPISSVGLHELLTRTNASARVFLRKLDIFPSWAMCELNRRSIARDYRNDLGLITPSAAQLEQQDDDGSVAYIKTYLDKGHRVPHEEAFRISEKYGWKFWDKENAV